MVVKRVPLISPQAEDSGAFTAKTNGETLPTGQPRPTDSDSSTRLDLHTAIASSEGTAAATGEGEGEGEAIEETYPTKLQNIIDRLWALDDKPPGTFADLTGDEIRMLCQRSTSLHLDQPMFLNLGVPIRICGDIHGQFHDLLQVLKTGEPPQHNYLFLGDYVDRGRNSIETICLLLSYKLLYPEHIFLLRGNHESAVVNQVYGFYMDCKRRYSIRIYRAFSDLFNVLPVAAIVEDRILCMHGGITPELDDLNAIGDIPRPCEVPNSGVMADLLWADPSPEITEWEENERGISYIFGSHALEDFMQQHDLDLIVRAHQVVEDGYEFFANRRMVTIFTARNYCGEFDNAGAIIIADEELMLSFKIFPPAGQTDEEEVHDNDNNNNSDVNNEA